MQFNKLWFSPTLKEKSHELLTKLRTIDRSLSITYDKNAQNLVFVVTIDEILKHIGSKRTIITDIFIDNAVKQKIRNLHFLKPGYQYISLCLSPLVITCTGFEQSKITDIALRIQLLGGVFQRQFSDDTSLLIAGKSLTPAYFHAIQNGIPVVKLEWLSKCFQEKERIDLQDYVFPCFYQITFTSTDLTKQCKHELKCIIENNGGKWSERIDDDTSYLISRTLCCTDKISTAISQKICIIKPEWIYTSAQMPKPPRDYILNWWDFNKERKNIFKGISFSNISDSNLTSAIKFNGGYFEPIPDIYITEYIDKTMSENKYVTPYWVWKCISIGEYIDISKSPAYTPLPYKTPVRDFKGWIISLIDIPVDIAQDFAYQIRTIGAVPYYHLSRQALVIISVEYNQEISSFSKKYNIPAVSVAWLTKTLSVGKAPGFKNYLLNSKRESILSNLVSKLNVSAQQIQSTNSDNHKNQNDHLGLFSQSSEMDNSSQVTIDNKKRVELSSDFSSDFDDDPLVAALMRH